MNYYQHPYVSNSDLSALKRETLGIEMPDNIDEIYEFGSLVDAMLTEPNLPDWSNLSLDGYFFHPKDWDLAVDMVYEVKKDNNLMSLIKHSKAQYEFYRTMEGDHDGLEWEVKSRCKFDLYNPVMSLDFKTTGCSSYKSFVDSIFHFDYDRQAAWYMDISRCDKFMIVGISKKTKEVYKYAICRGDKTYLSGKSKYSYLAYHYNLYF